MNLFHSGLKMNEFQLQSLYLFEIISVHKIRIFFIDIHIISKFIFPQFNVSSFRAKPVNLIYETVDRSGVET